MARAHPAPAPAGPLDDRQAPAEGLPDPGLQRPHVGALSPDQFQTGQSARERQQESWGTGAVLDSGGMHDDAQHQAKRVDEQVALAPRQLLRSIVAMRATALGRLDRLAVEDDSARRGMPPDCLAQPLTQDRVQALPGPIQKRGAQVAVHRGPRPVVVRQQAPLTATAQHVQDAVDDSAQVHSAWAPTGLGRRKQGGENGPLPLAQV